MNVEDILHYSPLRLVSTSPQASISEAAQRMAQFNVGLVVVMDDDDRIAGVLSERDIVNGLGEGAAIEETIVSDLMTESVISVSPTDSLIDAVLAMNTHGIRHLIVVQADKPVGVVSIRDVLRVFANQLLQVDSNADGEHKMEFVKALAAV